MQAEQLVAYIRFISGLLQIKADFYDIHQALKSSDLKVVKNLHDLYELLNQKSYVSHLLVKQERISANEWEDWVTRSGFPVMAFRKSDTVEPVLFYKAKPEVDKKDVLMECTFSKGQLEHVPATTKNDIASVGYLRSKQLLGDQIDPDQIGDDSDYIIFTFLQRPSMVSDDSRPNHKLTPFQRVMHLLRNERLDIGLIYFYAIMMGAVNLSLPLGIQAIIGLVSGGLFLNSVIVLIIIVILATVVAGWIQVLQLTVVEKLQQRIFAKSAFEFAYRIPRIRMEMLFNRYPPEVMNRFFDILTIQKSLPKILIDFSTAGIQILFGLIMLALYHPLFIVFGVIVISIIFVIFYFTSPGALEYNIKSSKYKYKVAYWLEELARNMHTFKLAGEFMFPIQKMDKLLNKYLVFRQNHFNVIVKQFKAIIAFKVFITGGLLILGGFLLVDRQINLGQFVAAEIIILLVISSVEKLISTLESVYDLLTAADKVGEVTDMVLERESGMDCKDLVQDRKLDIQVSNLSYQYGHSQKTVLHGMSFSIRPFESICISGSNGSGRTTLAKILAGLYENYKGKIIVNGIHLNEINLNSYRNLVADNLSEQDFFEGTIEENITLQKDAISVRKVLACLTTVRAMDFVNELKSGIKTDLEAHADILPQSIKHKLLLARALARDPNVLIIDESMMKFGKEDKQYILTELIQNKNMSVILISNNETFMQLCSRVLLIEEGKLVAQGTYDEVKQHEAMNYL